MSHKAAGGEIRKLAYRDGDETVQEVRRFKRATIQAILHNQDNIVMLEESMSRGNCSGEAVGQLTGYILDHGLFSKVLSMWSFRQLTITTASLIKSYKELSLLKQPGQQKSRKFGRLFATTLHEPRYWYGPDALDLVDLSTENVRQSHDYVCTFLQKNMPVNFLDRVGKERRELDEIERNKELPTGK